MKKIIWLLLFIVLPAAGQPVELTEGLLGGLRFRSIGPAMTGGRIHDVEGHPGRPGLLYVATASGGLWKTENFGTTWTPVFDDQPVSTFGDVTIAPSNPEIVWAGTGEQNNRQSTSWGNGVYRSADGGATWTHLGLVETRHVGRIRVHPRDPDVAYVAALGNLWRANPERGVFKTTDGGRTWTHALVLDSLTGVVDLAMDPRDPETLYAAAYQRLRRTWGFNGGGPGGGIYKTTDGGATWTRLADGLPEGDVGRIGLAIAETNPQVLVATVEHAEEAGVYRTEDGGATWTKVNDLNPRPMYYSHIYIDPTDADRLYILATDFYRSDDGGQTFRELPTQPTYDVGVHSDHHALWINPHQPVHFFLGGDGGLHETWDMGETYRRIENLPIGQFYAIGLDNRDPYHIYGGMQDNHSWVGPSETRWWRGILNDDWKQTNFGDGMYQQPDPTSHRYVYTSSQGGNISRVDAETGDLLGLKPHPEGDESYRFDWTAPILVSSHDPATVYLGGDRLFTSRDRGASWTASEKLTRGIDRDTLFLMGVRGSEPMLSKNDGAAMGELTTLAESPIDARVLWAGSDDGIVQVTRDGGTTWAEVGQNVRGVRDGTYVSRVVASAAGAGVAYVTFDAHRDGDFRPYVFKTTDFGRSWEAITEGLPDEGSVNVIVEHPDRPSLLFLGTEHALFASADAGASWTRFASNLPTTLFDDLKIHPREKDLVAGTHGRSLWVLDDTTPLAEWDAATARAPAHLFSIQPARQFHFWKATSYRTQAFYAGENPAFGALLTYHLSAPVDSVMLVVSDAAGREVRRLTGGGEAGVFHRLAWDLRHEPPPYRQGEPSERKGLVRSKNVLPALTHPLDPVGPFVAPGRYTVTLHAGEATSTQTVDVEADPKMDVSEEDLRAREAFLLEVLAEQRRAWAAVDEAEAIQKALEAERDGADEPDERLEAQADSAAAVVRELRRVRSQIYSLAGDLSGQAVRPGSLHPPTQTHRMRLVQLREELSEAMERLRRLQN